MVTSGTTVIDLESMGKKARQAGKFLAAATTEQKNAALTAIADAIEANAEGILEANRIDLQAARANGTDPLWIRDRLDLEKRIPGIIQDVRKVVQLNDPVGEVFDEGVLENGLKVSKRRTPLGVLGVIYEARPNVTVDVATLALKTGNAAIMRGGSEVLNSNMKTHRNFAICTGTVRFPPPMLSSILKARIVIM